MRHTSDTDRRRTAPDRPATDDRGVSEIIGAILMFGLVLLLLVVVQATAVPAWNQQTEFEHSQRVQEDWQEFDAAAAGVAADGVERTVVVETGVRYPSRPFLINPPPASGSIETMPESPVAIENARVDDTNGYWTGTREFPTRALRYRPDYREYRNGPTTVYETGMLHNRFPGATVVLDDGSVVEGREVTLQVLDGEYAAARTGPTSVEVRPTSAPARTVRMRPDGGPIVVRLPTLLDEATLTEEVFADECDDPGCADTAADNSPDRYVRSVTVTPGSPYNTAEITLESGTSYSLTMSEVGVGTVDREGAAYVTRVGAGDLLVPAPGTTDLTVEVRDRYNNPVAGETVTFEVAAGSAGDFGAGAGTVAVQTGPEGRATAAYEAPAVNTTDNVVTASIDGGADPWTRVGWEIDTNTEVGVGGPGGSGPEDAVSTLNPGSGDGVPYVAGVDVLGGGGSGRLTVCFVNGADPTTFSQGRISFFAEGNQEKSHANVTDVDGTAVAPPQPRLAVGGGYADLSAAVGSIDDRKRVTFEFDTGFSSNEFFVVSVRYDDGASTDTVSYMIGAEDIGTCSGP